MDAERASVGQEEEFHERIVAAILRVLPQSDDRALRAFMTAFERRFEREMDQPSRVSRAA
jgi:hypothetical protein